MSPSVPERALGRAVRWFEQGVMVALVAMMLVVIALATLDVGWILIEDVLTPPVALLTGDELLEIFGVFLLVLIGLELLETVKAYLHTHAIRVDIVLEVALIAIARKIIVLDLERYDGVSVIGIAALVVTLAAADYLVRRARPASAGRPP